MGSKNPEYDATSLGNLCRMNKRVGDATLRAVVHDQAKTPDTPMGTLLLQRGAVTRDELEQLLREQDRLRAGQQTLQDVHRMVDYAIERMQKVSGALADAATVLRPKRRS